MALNVARKGWIGVGVESTFGNPVAMTDNIYWTTETLDGIQKPLFNESAYSLRSKEFNAVGGQQYGKGDIEFNLDPSKSGYFLAAALGSTSSSTTSGITTHTLTQSQSNTPYSLSLYVDRVTDRQLYTGATVDTLEIKVQDKFATAKAALNTLFPVTSASGTVTTASGTMFRWADYQVQFGSNYSGALAAAATPLTEFDVTFKNNSEVIFESGKATASRIAQKDFEVDGNFTKFFENTTDLNAFYNTTKNAMILTFNGAGYEKLTLNFYSAYFDTFAIETGIDNFFIEKAKFTTTYSQADSKHVDGTLVNANSNY